MQVSSEEVENFIRKSWECNHLDSNTLPTYDKDGWCGICGCVPDRYTLTIGLGDQIVVAANGSAFFHNGRFIWYKAALYSLGLLKISPPSKAPWRPIEESERLCRPKGRK